MAMYQNITHDMGPKEAEAFHGVFHENIPGQFQDLLSDLADALAQEAWLGDEGWDPACEVFADTEAAWRDIAARAGALHDTDPMVQFLPLQRMAGLIRQAVQAVSLDELDEVCARSARCVGALGARDPKKYRDLVIEARDYLDEMSCQAAAWQARDGSAEAGPAQALRFAA